MEQQNIEGINKNKEYKNGKNTMLNTFKKSFPYLNIKNDMLNSSISETTTKYSELDNSGNESYLPITENQIDPNEINRMNYTKSIPSKLIYVPKNITINEQDSDDTNHNKGQYDDKNGNMNYNHKNNKSMVTSSNNQKTLNHPPLFNQKKTYPFRTNSSISKKNKSKKLLLPWYLKKKRQISFSKKDIKTFYNYSKCSDYEKYENYFSKIHHITKKKNENVDISLDKTAIELKELHFGHFKGNNNDQSYHHQHHQQKQQQSELEDNTDRIIEKEIACKINGIVLNEVQTKTDNVNQCFFLIEVP